MIVAQRIDPLPAPLTPQQQADRPYALGMMEIVPTFEPLVPPPSIGSAPGLLRYGAGFRGCAGDDYAGNNAAGPIVPAAPAKNRRREEPS